LGDVMDEGKKIQDNSTSSQNRLNLNVLLKRLKEEQNTEKKQKIIFGVLLAFVSVAILGVYLLFSTN